MDTASVVLAEESSTTTFLLGDVFFNPFHVLHNASQILLTVSHFFVINLTDFTGKNEVSSILQRFPNRKSLQVNRC